MTFTNFAEALRVQRAVLGWRSQDVARMAGISPNTLTLYEQGVRMPRLDVALRLASVLGISLDRCASALARQCKTPRSSDAPRSEGIQQADLEAGERGELEGQLDLFSESGADAAGSEVDREPGTARDGEHECAGSEGTDQPDAA